MSCAYHFQTRCVFEVPLHGGPQERLSQGDAPTPCIKYHGRIRYVLEFVARGVSDLSRYSANGTPVIARIVDKIGGSSFYHFVVIDGVTT